MKDSPARMRRRPQVTPSMSQLQGRAVREGLRLGSGGPHLPSGRARAPITRVLVIAYRAVLGKLLTSVSPFRDDNSSVLWGYMN